MSREAATGMSGGLVCAQSAACEVVQPVLYVFGTRDLKIFTRKQVRDAQARFVTGPYRQLEVDAGHWLIQEQPQATVEAVMTHLQEHAF